MYRPRFSCYCARKSPIPDAKRSALLLAVMFRFAGDRPIISFSFDDFPRTALTAGGSILQDAGVRGTYYVAPGLMIPQTTSVRISAEKTCEIFWQQGMSWQVQTYSHASARTSGFANYVNDVEKGYQNLAETFGLNASRQFSYPYGEITLRVKRTVGAKMQSCRGIWPGLTGLKWI